MHGHVFISYAAAEREIAGRVCAGLEKRGTTCWIAPRDVTPGKTYAAEIVRAVQSASSMVLIFSAKANASPHVVTEVERAFSLGVRIFPFRTEDVGLSEELQYYLSRPHWVDAFGSDLEPAMQRLMEHVTAAKSDWMLAHPVPSPREPPPREPPPPEPPEVLPKTEPLKRRHWIRWMFLATILSAGGYIALVEIVRGPAQNLNQPRMTIAPATNTAVAPEPEASRPHKTSKKKVHVSSEPSN